MHVRCCSNAYTAVLLAARGTDRIRILFYIRQGGMEHVLFVEIGFGNDQHGQNATKACVRYVPMILHSSFRDAYEMGRCCYVWLCSQ